MLRQLALNIDIFILGIMTRNMTTVGLFGGPYRLSWSLRVIPQSLSLPLYPLYSRTAHLSAARFGEVYRQSLKFFTLISVPIATFFMAWSKPLLTLALGTKFLPALPAMQLLGLGLIPFFISTLFPYLFAALDLGVDQAGQINQDIFVPDRGDTPLPGRNADRYVPVLVEDRRQ